MKKNILVIAIIAMMVLTSACGKTSDKADNTGGESGDKAETEASAEETAEEVTEEEAEEAETEDAEAEEESGYIISFTTTDLDGNEITSEELFAENKYTMVNCWASWCPPCIREIPKLDDLNEEFKEQGCGVIGVLTDGNDETGLADGKLVIQDAEVAYTNIIPWEGFEELGINAFPTSFFVDSKGMVVGEVVLGARFSSYSKVLKDLLE